MTTLLAILFTFYVTRVIYTRRIIRDNTGSPYLIRYFIFKSKFLERRGWGGRIYLHRIMRSDHDRALHDHPFNFVSFMLWGGYREWNDIRQVKRSERHKWVHDYKEGLYERGEEVIPYSGSPIAFRDFHSPTVLHRGAGWRHRLELTNGKSCWTLVFRSGKVREWGFWQNLGQFVESFCPWHKYNPDYGICEDE